MKRSIKLKIRRGILILGLIFAFGIICFCDEKAETKKTKEPEAAGDTVKKSEEIYET